MTSHIYGRYTIAIL